MAHTSGPWMLDGEERVASNGPLIGVWIAKDDGKGECAGRIAQVFGNCLVKTDSRVLANAHLVKAAPGLFAACAKLIAAANEREIATATRMAHAAFLAACGSK
jgi:hypothetical protein